jgi:hypothetical protein
VVGDVAPVLPAVVAELDDLLLDPHAPAKSTTATTVPTTPKRLDTVLSVPSIVQMLPFLTLRLCEAGAIP